MTRIKISEIVKIVCQKIQKQIDNDIKHNPYVVDIQLYIHRDNVPFWDLLEQSQRLKLVDAIRSYFIEKDWKVEIPSGVKEDGFDIDFHRNVKIVDDI